MVRKTRRHHSNKKSKGAYSIPELRRAFEHIELYIDEKIASKESKEKIVKDLRKEWPKVFFKDLDKKSADSFVSDKLSKKRKHKRTTLRGGSAPLGSAPLGSAPLGYTTRPGEYLAPGQIPDMTGHLPLSDGSKSSYGSFTSYVGNGFWNPVPGRSLDPLQDQQRFPISVPVGMGSNLIKGGKRKTRRRGGGLIDSMSKAMASSSAPPSIISDMRNGWHGISGGISPDQVQRSPKYV